MTTRKGVEFSYGRRVGDPIELGKSGFTNSGSCSDCSAPKNIGLGRPVDSEFDMEIQEEPKKKEGKRTPKKKPDDESKRVLRTPDLWGEWHRLNSDVTFDLTGDIIIHYYGCARLYDPNKKSDREWNMEPGPNGMEAKYSSIPAKYRLSKQRVSAIICGGFRKGNNPIKKTETDCRIEVIFTKSGLRIQYKWADCPKLISVVGEFDKVEIPIDAGETGKGLLNKRVRDKIVVKLKSKGGSLRSRIRN